MKQSQKLTMLTGVVFIVLGLLLLGSLVDIFESIVIYMWVIPFVFLVSGFSMLQNSAKTRTALGYGLIATGSIMLLVRFGWINGALVNALLAAALISTGSILLTRKETDKKHRDTTAS